MPGSGAPVSETSLEGSDVLPHRSVKSEISAVPTAAQALNSLQELSE